jgi:MYXO-CTERM domain-containing protein
MTMRPRSLTRAVLCGAAVLAASSASAGSVELRFDGVDPGEKVRVYLDTDGNGSYDFNKRINAGVMNWTNRDTGGRFDTFCIELTQTISAGQQRTYTLHDDLTAAPRTDGVILSDTKADKLELFWGQYRDLVVDSDTASAFQVGIWEIVYDGDGVLDIQYGSGTFSVSSHSSYQDTFGIASQWLNGLDLNGERADLMALSNAHKQDQITEVPTPGAAAAGLVLLGLATRRRRRVVEAG